MSSLIQRLRAIRLPSLSSSADASVPFWAERPPRAAPPEGRLRVLWSGSGSAPVPVITRDPPDFDPTR